MEYAIPSRRFIETLKRSLEPAYKISWRAGVHPNTLSKLISGYLRPRVNDPRILAVGRELGLKPAECFEPEPSKRPRKRTPAPDEDRERRVGAA
jgi:hypothetical protein